jgi:hypothetical protein
MALEIIGSGFGRTGTLSLKLALEQLGFGPCHHMAEAFGDPEQPARWLEAASSDNTVWTSPQWDALFAGYRSQVDWPGSHMWRQLAAAYPGAKVIHSVRPEEKWWASFDQTIGRFISEYDAMPLPPHVRTMCEAADLMIGTQTFDGKWLNKDAALAAYRRRTEEVRAAIAPERLLVYDVAEGWEPLCAFLGVPVPEADFPRTNAPAEFWSHFAPPPS